MQRTSWLVVHQGHDGLGVLVLVVGLDVDRGVARGHPRLPQVEGDHGKPEGHVFHRLVHRRHVIERILGVRRKTGVRGRHDAHDEFIGRPPGELHVPRQAEFVTQCYQVVVAVSRADQREGDVVAAELVDHDVGRPDHDVHAVLRAHDTDVGDEEPAAAAQVRVGLTGLQPPQVRPGTDDRDLVGPLAAARHRDLPVRVVRGDDVIRGPVRPALEGQQPPVRQLRAAGETRLEELGAEVVMVEHEAGSLERAEGQGQRPEDVGRVAGLDHGEAPVTPGLERSPRRGEERVRVLGDEAGLAAAGCIGPVLVQLHRVDDLVSRVAAALRADDGHLVTGRDQRLALQPHPPVEGHRKVLDDDKEPGQVRSARCGAACPIRALRGGR